MKEKWKEKNKMSNIEVIDVQCEIIRLQALLIKRLALQAGQLNVAECELKMDIDNLRTEIEAQNE